MSTSLSDIRVSLQQLDIMRYAVGAIEGEAPHRNFILANEEHRDYGTLMELVDMGLMRREGSGLVAGGQYMFRVTDNGFLMLGLPETEEISQ